MSENTESLSRMLGIRYPIIVAPMFLVSSPEMVIAALKSGCTAAMPSLNFRTSQELRDAIRRIKETQPGPFGINLIVNKSNFRLKQHLELCIEEGVAFYITSLGNPSEVIQAAHAHGALVFSDVVNVEHAVKVEKSGADAVIAVNNRAGGHAGPLSRNELISELKKNISIPIISAGGIARSEDLKEALDLGAAGVSVGSVFIASEEAPVTAAYKQAIVDYGAKDIVMTTRLSGTPCTVINTPYVKEAGLQPGWMERMYKKNKRLRKFFKMLLFLKGMRDLRKAAYSFTYQSVWCAGPSIEHVHAVRPMKEIIADLTKGMD